MRFEADGTVTLRTGVQPMGQGHLSTFPPLIARKIGIDSGRVRLIQGESDEVPAGTPSVASRSLMRAGSAAALACDAAIDKGRHLAARLLEAAPFDVDFADGRSRQGTDRGIDILELAARTRGPRDRDADRDGGADGSGDADHPAGLDSTATFVSPRMSFPNGCHVCEVKIDPDTGALSVARYSAVDDVGTTVHQTFVEGQIHCGVAQGLGQVFGEQVVYDERGQLLIGSFMDYPVPRARDLPDLAVGHHVVP